MADKRKETAATRAVKKNTGMLGAAARALGSRRDRLDEILGEGTTPDRRVKVGK
jgi:hypothetical protein